MREDLIEDDLFGNEAGEDESKERLNEYYLEKPLNKAFFSDYKKLQFVRARKGVGKSALLNYSAYRIEDSKKDDLLISLKASELITLYDCSTKVPLEYTHCWEQRICMRIINELAKKIKFAFNDDSMTIIENAEISGFKGRNIVSALADRFKIQLEKISVENNKAEVGNSFELLKRFTNSKDIKVWLFIDDIDATFINNEENKIIVGTFFTACRYLVNSVNGLNIRASVRTDVWTILKNFDEALDKCEQYMLDLVWSTKDTGDILAKKILTYFNERYPQNGYDKWDYQVDQKKIYKLVFREKIRWGKASVAPHRCIHILSAGRPRWAAQLSKIAAKDAHSKQLDIIGIGNINFAMKDYGRFRMADLYKEHKHQCPELEVLIEIFRNKQKAYPSKALLQLIQDRIIDKGKKITIDEKEGETDGVSLAKFLYRIGFITLRNNEYNKALGFTRFEDDPYLFSEDSISNDDLWEIHPSYRTVLCLD